MDDVPNDEATQQLWEAIHNYNFPAIKALLDAGANVNARNSLRSSPLHEAASRGNLAAVAMLLDKGADANFRNRDGKLAHDLAKENQHERLAELLAQRARASGHVAEIIKRRQSGRTPNIGG